MSCGHLRKYIFLVQGTPKIKMLLRLLLVKFIINSTHNYAIPNTNPEKLNGKMFGATFKNPHFWWVWVCSSNFWGKKISWNIELFQFSDSAITYHYVWNQKKKLNGGFQLKLSGGWRDRKWSFSHDPQFARVK